jgi:hypothetical protein
MNITDPVWLQDNTLLMELGQRVRVSPAWFNEEGKALLKEVPVGKGRVFVTWALTVPYKDDKLDIPSAAYRVVTFPYNELATFQSIHREFPVEVHDLLLHCTDSHYQKRTTCPCRESLVAKIRAKGSDLKPENKHLALVPPPFDQEGLPIDAHESWWDKSKALKERLTSIDEVIKRPWWPLYEQIVEGGSEPSEDLVPPEPIASLDALMYAVQGDWDYPALTSPCPSMHSTRRWEGEWFLMDEGQLWCANNGWTTASEDRVREWAQGLPEPEPPVEYPEETTIDEVIESLLDD